MPIKQIAQDSFEQLGQMAKQAGQQVSPGKFGEIAKEQLGLKPPSTTEQATQSSAQQVQQQEEARKKEQAKRRRLQQLSAELELERKKAVERFPEQVSGKPGFSEEKAIKQIELEEEGEKKKKLPPVVELAKKKGGTGERKIMGVSG